MKHKTIAYIKELFVKEKLTEENIEELKSDGRKGVQQLIAGYERRQAKQRQLERDFNEIKRYEQVAYEKGYRHVAGIDEAGRGPLAGPVVAAAVILPKDFTLLGLTDSKLLSEAKREQFYQAIIGEAISYGIAIINNRMVDQINILEATKLAMYTSINELKQKPDYLLIDAVELKNLDCAAEAIVKGDQKSMSIAAASILAKVTRDRLMKAIHIEYPVYDFKSNMGYGTKHHLDMIQLHGITPYHRTTFAPVRNIINGCGHNESS